MRYLINKIVFLIVVFTGFPFWGITQVKSIGTPSIQNYPKSVYRAGTQNWSISQDDNDFMYFANNSGVLRFDGTHWDLFEVSKSSPVRSIYIDNENKIYIGLFNDFGILKQNEAGQLIFNSLRKMLPPEVTDFDDIWKIHRIQQGILFQSFNYVFILKGNEVEVIRPEKRFHFSFIVNGRLFLHEPENGLFEYINDKMAKVPWAGELAGKEIWGILELKENELLIGTSRDGIYKFGDGKLAKWETPVNNLVENYQLFSATRLTGNYYAFGTILNGIFISDENGEVIQHINRNHGLQNNTVLSMFQDKSSNLWLGLDNGIDYIEINSPITFNSDFGNIGTGYASCIFDDKFYLGTNQGLFVRATSNDPSEEDFKLIENSAGQVWSLDIFNNQLICGHNLGTFVINGNTAEKISNEEGVWGYIPLKNHPDILLGGNYTGLLTLKYSGNGWEFQNKIKGFYESSRFLAESSDGSIWMSHGAKGIFRIELNAAIDSVVNYKLYNSAHGLPTNEQNILFQLNNRAFISTIYGIYEYRLETDDFIPSEELNELFSIEGQLKEIKADDSGNIWFISDQESGVFRVNEDLTYTKITSPFKQLDDMYVNGFEFVFPYSNDHTIFGIDNGFAHYTSTFSKSYAQPVKAFISKIEMPYIDSTLLLLNQELTAGYKFPFNKNSFRFHYTAPFYEKQDRVQFSFILENYDDKWSVWNESTYRDFTNLPHGTYNFKLKARNIYGVESNISSFEFKIMPPWFQSATAYTVYILLFIVIILFTVNFVLHRMKVVKNRETKKLLVKLGEKEKKFHHQALLAEKEIIRLQNEHLQEEMVHRDKELANQTLNIIEKNKFLIKLKDDLTAIQKTTFDEPLKKKIKSVSRNINKEIDNKQQNQIFETYFDDVHDEFFGRLKQKYPQLSPREMRLCAFIRMNLTSKEIAVLLNITDRGVEIGRYRLRKKMGLSRDINLSTYLSNI